jgi:hypothetical protein
MDENDYDAEADTAIGKKPRSGPSRRGVVIAAAWAVPVITLAVATPAFAASANASLTLVWGNGSAARFTGASLADATATVVSRGGSWDVGENVTFTVLSGPASFGGGAFAVIPTGPAGTAMATGLTATGVGTVVLQASVSGLPTQTIIIVVQAPVPVLAIDNPIQTPAGGASTVLTGTVTVNGVAPTTPNNYPVTYTITGGTAQFAGGVQTVTVNPASGTGVVTALPLTAASGYLGDVIVTATVAGGNTQTYNLAVGYTVVASSLHLTGVRFLPNGRPGITGDNESPTPNGTLPAGTVMDITWTNGFVPSPNSGWAMTSLGGGTYRFVSLVDMIVGFAQTVCPQDALTQDWSAYLYLVGPRITFTGEINKYGPANSNLTLA